ncbi:MAG: hypothetical protein RIS48_714 [Pseudomonadota bacterium]|jgi:hypothetical protein
MLDLHQTKSVAYFKKKILKVHYKCMFKHPSLQFRQHRWVLLCLLLCWVTAYTAPLFKSQAAQQICSSAGGVMWVVTDGSDDQDHQALKQVGLDCAQCLPVALLPQDLQIAALGQPQPHPAPGFADNSAPPKPVAMAPPARAPPVLFYSPTKEVST